MDYSDTDEYALTDDEKEGLTSDEQAVWAALKTVHRKPDIESEIARVMSEHIAKEIDANVLNSLLGIMNGTATK